MQKIQRLFCYKVQKQTIPKLSIKLLSKLQLTNFKTLVVLIKSTDLAWLSITAQNACMDNCFAKFQSNLTRFLSVKWELQSKVLQFSKFKFYKYYTRAIM